MDLSTAFIERSHLCCFLSSLPHHSPLLEKWLKEHTLLTQHTLNNYKKDIKTTSMLWEEFPLKKVPIIYSKIHSLCMPNIFLAHSLLSTHMIGLRTNFLFFGELLLLPCSQFNSLHLHFPHIWELSLPIHLPTHQEWWLISGLRKMELIPSMEIIEEQQHGCGMVQLGILDSLVSLKIISGKFSLFGSQASCLQINLACLATGVLILCQDPVTILQMTALFDNR